MKIKLNQIENLESEDILELIKDEVSITVSIPKPSVLFFNTNEEVAMDYLNAAYVGYQLEKHSFSISYSGGKLNSNNDIEFEFVPKGDLNELANTIIDLSVGFGNGDDIAQFDFGGILEHFLEDTQNKEIVFPEFLKNYFEYIKDGNDDSK